MHSSNRPLVVLTVVTAILGGIAALITIAEAFGWQIAMPQWVSSETVESAIGAALGMAAEWPVGPFWSAALIVLIAGVFIAAILAVEFFDEEVVSYLVGLLLTLPFAVLWGVRFWGQMGTVSLWLYGALFLLGPFLAYVAAMIPLALLDELTTVRSIAGRITEVRRQESHESKGDKSTTFIIDIDCEDGTAKTVYFDTSKRKSPLLKAGNHLKASGSWKKGASRFHTKKITLSSLRAE